MNKALFIQEADPRREPATALMRALSEEEAIRYADLGSDTFDSFQPEDVLSGRGVFVVAFLEGRPVGCGGLRQMDSDAAEINRMYVVPMFRRRGVAQAILNDLEARAAAFFYRVVRAETGNRQPEAVSLYERAGFRRVLPFGSHANDPVSLFFEKPLNHDSTCSA